jgi:hypothetical protein
MKQGRKFYCRQWRKDRKTKGLCLRCSNTVVLNRVHCVDCRKILANDHYRDIRLKSQLNRLYKITPEERMGLNQFQKKACAICGKKANPKHWMDMDHDHEDGLIRGLLCNTCNAGIGRFKTIAILQSAISYLLSPPATAFFGTPRYGKKGHAR